MNWKTDNYTNERIKKIIDQDERRFEKFSQRYRANRGEFNYLMNLKESNFSGYKHGKKLLKKRKRKGIENKI